MCTHFEGWLSECVRHFFVPSLCKCVDKSVTCTSSYSRAHSYVDMRAAVCTCRHIFLPTGILTLEMFCPDIRFDQYVGCACGTCVGAVYSLTTTASNLVDTSAKPAERSGIWISAGWTGLAATLANLAMRRGTGATTQAL